jgi:hypothetical protein
MKFVLGVTLGFAAGFAGAILFAPEKRRGAPIWPDGHPAASLNGNNKGGLRGAVATLQDHVNQAWEEARVAAEKAERDMMARYELEKQTAEAEAEQEAAETKKK